MLFIGLKNIATQDIGVDETINLGTVYRKFDKRGATCGRFAFSTDSASLTLQQKGMYHVTAVVTFTAPATGDITFQLFENGTAIDGAIATNTIATATTEFITTTLDYYVLVDNVSVLGSPIAQKVITLVNTGLASTIDNVVFNVEKVV